MRILAATMSMFALCAPALAGNSQPGVLNRCAKLLPEGKDYAFKVDGTARHDPNRTTVEHTVVVE